MRHFLMFTAFIVGLGFAAHGLAKTSLTDDQIRTLLIQKSILSYPGSCPCPYSIDRGGRRCGRRSAYSKPGGYSPLCYPSDVTQKMIDEYRKRHSG